jgi:hypothetical protein
MSINDVVDSCEAIAVQALFKAKALDDGSLHGVTIRVGDADAERHAYAIATNMLKVHDKVWMREECPPFSTS